MEKQKRERSSNFTAEETNLLISLVEVKLRVIENKKSDATTWHDKEKAWKDIEKAFNSVSGSVFRDYKHLKLKYEAIKRDTRKKCAMIRSERYKTGGGSGTALPLTTVEEKVKSMILRSLEGNESPSDSDLDLPSTSCYSSLLMSYSFQNSSENIEIKKEEDSEPPSKPSSENIEIKKEEEEDSEPPSKKVYVELHEETLPQNRPKEKRPFERLIEEKLEIAEMQNKLVTEELEQKLIQRKLLEYELEHKEIIYELEKQSLLLKIAILKRELGEN